MRNLKNNLQDYLKGYVLRDGIDSRRKKFAGLLNKAIDSCQTLTDVDIAIKNTIKNVKSIKNCFLFTLDDRDHFLASLTSLSSSIKNLIEKHKKAHLVIDKLSPKLPLASILKQLFKEKDFIYSSNAGRICGLMCNNYIVNLIDKLKFIPSIALHSFPPNGSIDAIDFSSNAEAIEAQSLLRSLWSLSKSQLSGYEINPKEFDDLKDLLQNILMFVNDLKHVERALLDINIVTKAKATATTSTSALIPSTPYIDDIFANDIELQNLSL